MVLKKIFSKPVKKVEMAVIDKFEITIPKEQWAPGMWAGAEGIKLKLGNLKLEANSIDLLNRVIKVKLKPKALKAFAYD